VTIVSIQNTKLRVRRIAIEKKIESILSEISCIFLKNDCIYRYAVSFSSNRHKKTKVFAHGQIPSFLFPNAFVF
ncbi:MAG: hypothetical protein ACRCXN_01175, partial [Bacteroidales bacterium]